MLSRTSTYALRALTFLAGSSPDAWHLNRHIARELGLPPQFLTKILSTLVAEEILESQRGRAGGFRLARPASRISLLEVVEPFDRLVSREVCMLGQKSCSDEFPCPLHAEWKEISRSLSELLRKTSLAQLAGRTGIDGYPGPIPLVVPSSGGKRSRSSSTRARARSKSARGRAR
jgi:Rrf2 family protein